jgi:hypothetical protein
VPLRVPPQLLLASGNVDDHVPESVEPDCAIVTPMFPLLEGMASTVVPAQVPMRDGTGGDGVGEGDGVEGGNGVDGVTGGEQFQAAPSDNMMSATRNWVIVAPFFAKG